jgi:hypothetical protein
MASTFYVYFYLELVLDRQEFDGWGLSLVSPTCPRVVLVLG